MIARLTSVEISDDDTMLFVYTNNKITNFVQIEKIKIFARIATVYLGVVVAGNVKRYFKM